MAWSEVKTGGQTMIGMPEGVRKLLIAYDVAGYGGRGKRQQFAVQQRLVDVLGYALTEARVSGYELQPEGDGGLGLLPTGEGVDEPRVIATLIASLEDGLAEINADLVAEARIRLRVALDEGVVHRAAHGFTGPAVVGVCRLRDAPVVRETLAACDADLIVVMADHLYRDAVAGGRARRPAFTRAAVTVKEFSGTAWLYLSGSARLPSPLAPLSTPLATAGQRDTDEAGERLSGSRPPRAPSLKHALETDPRLW
jgi:hypothetical protein